MTTMAVDSSECKEMNLEQTFLGERGVVKKNTEPPGLQVPV